ncbi:MAG: permease [Tissierellia bacterium]|nr:permease [Tissierellia bacterium]
MKRNRKNLLIISIIIITILIFNNKLAELIAKYSAGFSIVFWSILLEAMPFVLLGCLISSLIGQFISANFLAKLIPKNRILGILFAALLGIVFPLCECIIVPITRRLIKKGLPMPLAIAFMLSVPILNPVVLFSTHYAFKGHSFVVFLRAVLGYFAAVTIAILIGRIFGYDYNPIQKNNLKPNLKIKYDKVLVSQKQTKTNRASNKNIISIIQNVLSHTFWEFTDVLKFLILGAFLSAILQTTIPRNAILKIGTNNFISVPILMLLAFLLSLCSEADAFIARTFVGQFSYGGIISFLIFGPMLDIKNMMMLFGAFKKKFVIILMATISLICFAFGILVNVVI